MFMHQKVVIMILMNYSKKQRKWRSKNHHCNHTGTYFTKKINLLLTTHTT